MSNEVPSSRYISMIWSLLVCMLADKNWTNKHFLCMISLYFLELKIWIDIEIACSELNFFSWLRGIILCMKCDGRFALLRFMFYWMWANVFYGCFFFFWNLWLTWQQNGWIPSYMTKILGIWQVRHENVNAEFTLYMINFWELDRSDMLTKMVEFCLHMTNFLGIW